MKAATRAGPQKRRTPQGWQALVRWLKELRLLATYYLTAILQSPLGALFWALEQRRARLADKLANMGIEL